MTWRELKSLIIEALRASDFDPIMKNMNIIHDRSKRASVLFRKWKGGRDDESILKEKWLTFKRPLTEGNITMKKLFLSVGIFITIISLNLCKPKPSLIPSNLYQYLETEFSELRNDRLFNRIFEGVDLSNVEDSNQLRKLLRHNYYTHYVEEDIQGIDFPIQIKESFNLTIHTKEELTQKDDEVYPSGCVYASVVDKDGNFVTGLNKQAFSTIDSSIGIKDVEELSSSHDLPVDIVFVVDESGSMHDDIDVLRNNIRDFTERIENRGVDWRLGLVTYEKEVKQRHDPVKDVGRFMGWLPDKAWGGYEVAEDALNAACDLEFRDNCQKMIILCSDEYIIQGFSKANICDVVKKLLNNGINVYQVLNLDQNNSEFLSAFTQGKVYNLNSGFEEILNSLERELIQRYKINYEQLVPQEIITIIQRQKKAGRIDLKPCKIRFFPLGYYKPKLEKNFDDYRKWVKKNPSYIDTLDDVLSDKKSPLVINYAFEEIAREINHMSFDLLGKEELSETVLTIELEGFSDHRVVRYLRYTDEPLLLGKNTYTNFELAYLRAWHTRADLIEYLKKYCGERYDKLMEQKRIEFIVKPFGVDGVSPESEDISKDLNLSPKQKEDRYSYIRRAIIKFHKD